MAPTCGSCAPRLTSHLRLLPLTSTAVGPGLAGLPCAAGGHGERADGAGSKHAGAPCPACPAVHLQSAVVVGWSGIFSCLCLQPAGAQPRINLLPCPSSLHPAPCTCHYLPLLQLGREERWAHVLTQPERGCLLVARPREGLGMFKNTGGCSGWVHDVLPCMLVAPGLGALFPASVWWHARCQATCRLLRLHARCSLLLICAPSRLLPATWHCSHSAAGARRCRGQQRPGHQVSPWLGAGSTASPFVAWNAACAPLPALVPLLTFLTIICFSPP